VHVKMTFLKTVDEPFSEGYKHNGVSRFPLAQPIFNPIVLHSSPPPSGSLCLETEMDFVEAGEWLVKTGFDPELVHQLMHTLREASPKSHDCSYSS